MERTRRRLASSWGTGSTPPGFCGKERDKHAPEAYFAEKGSEEKAPKRRRLAARDRRDGRHAGHVAQRVSSALYEAESRFDSGDDSRIDGRGTSRQQGRDGGGDMSGQDAVSAR